MYVVIGLPFILEIIKSLYDHQYFTDNQKHRLQCKSVCKGAPKRLWVHSPSLPSDMDESAITLRFHHTERKQYLETSPQKPDSQTLPVEGNW